MIIRFLLAGVVLPFVLLATGLARAQDMRFGFRMLDTPRATPDLSFSDVNTITLSLQDFRGKYVLLNVWATWCPPCRAELPSLENLQDELGGSTFQVVALATDTGRRAAVLQLFDELGLDDSGVFIDENGTAMRDLGIFGMPTTLLIDANGNEVGRKLGPAEWDSPAAVAFFRAIIEDTTDSNLVTD